MYAGTPRLRQERAPIRCRHGVGYQCFVIYIYTCGLISSQEKHGKTLLILIIVLLHVSPPPKPARWLDLPAPLHPSLPPTSWGEGRSMGRLAGRPHLGRLLAVLAGNRRKNNTEASVSGIHPVSGVHPVSRVHPSRGKIRHHPFVPTRTLAHIIGTPHEQLPSIAGVLWRPHERRWRPKGLSHMAWRE